MKILFIFGTRPEAIKLCPLIEHLRGLPDFQTCVAVTAQHREMLDQALRIFGVSPDHDLSAMMPSQTLFQSTSRIVAGLEPVLETERPDLVVVQGDTTTTLCGALAAFYAGIPSGHVEAGLRTGDMRAPFPEEMNRVLVTRMASLHFAATDGAAANLRAEGVLADAIAVTGNTGVDAVMHTAARLEEGRLRSSFDSRRLDPARKLILVTAHRRESFGENFERICQALLELARRPDVQILYPVHRNPAVIEPVYRMLSGCPNIVLTEPLDYVSFVDLLRHSYIVMTDSGGVQEESPSLGKPVLVLRDKTERPEAVAAGTASLVGTDVRAINTAAGLLLDDAAEYARRSRIHNPYGDGRASERITAAIRTAIGSKQSA